MGSWGHVEQSKRRRTETLGILDSCILKKAGVGKKAGWLHSQKKKNGVDRDLLESSED